MIKDTGFFCAEASSGDKISYLRYQGKPLVEAQDLLSRREAELDSGVVSYIKAGIERAEALARQAEAARRRKMQTLVATSVVLVILTRDWMPLGIQLIGFKDKDEILFSQAQWVENFLLS